MTDASVLETTRLLLRPIELSDSLEIQKAAGAREIADTMISLPHPYPVGGVERYIALQQAERDAGGSVTFTIKHKTEAWFCGLIEVRDIDRTHSQGELSFWLAIEAWGRGYMSEAVQTVVQYGFESLDLNRLYAYHMLRNPASGRVLEKNGFKQEGLLRQRVRKWGQFEDVLLWAILQHEWQDKLDK
ncbi:MAG: GNAT family N-acetyltransferase [Candidatus Thiodiazotropha sp. (ex Codakia rugifera)]|nr:GNAT family N-acetyltransferase [Candidatus Thiodiazotropha sp. (ex Codakia rugifera)]